MNEESYCDIRKTVFVTNDEYDLHTKLSRSNSVSVCSTCRIQAKLNDRGECLNCQSNRECAERVARECTVEMVNHPKHYGGGDNPYECIKVIDALGHSESFCIGSALKYIFRYKNKGTAKEDLKKAIWYLQYVVDSLDKA